MPEDAPLPKGYENYIDIPISAHPEIKDAPLPKGYEGYIPYKDPITAATEKVAPWLGRAATEALPAIGSFAGAGGTLVGTAIAHLNNMFGKNKVGGMLIQMQKESASVGGDIARTQTYKQISSTTLSDIVHVQNAKMTAGSEFTNDIAVNKILTGAGGTTGNTIDAGKAF